MRLRWGVLVFLAAIGPLSEPVAARRSLTFADRVRAQTAIERLHYSHQVGTTRPFEEAVPRRLIERKVRTSLQQSVALQRIWQTPITARALDRELERIAAGTRMPERLREIYRALGDDPHLVRECFVRPLLADRLVRSFYETKRDRAPENENGNGNGFATAPSWDEWWKNIEASLDPDALAETESGADSLPQPVERTEFAAADACGPEGAWDEGSLGLPPSGGSYGSIWTGNVVVFWSGQGPSGGRYDPLTDTWSPTSRLNAPFKPGAPALIWTGSEMLVWGGGDGPGGRYDPASDTWTEMSTAGAPVEAGGPSAVWTGQRMIVWGGSALADGQPLASGGRYDPATDTWSPVSMAGAPEARSGHTAVWTGTQMLVWGGYGQSSYVARGARYDPSNDTWAAMTVAGAPSSRDGHVAVWTGQVMVVWGGGDDENYFATGGRYDPLTNKWISTAIVGAPAARTGPVGVWTGTRLVVWGGSVGAAVDTGGVYDPVANTWTATNQTGAPSGRTSAGAAWTGDLMVVWGGWDGITYLNTGGRYNLSTNSWTPTNTLNTPAQRNAHTAIWTGNTMIVWGGHGGNTDLNTGGRYDPLTDTWTPTSLLGAPSPRQGHSAVWTGNVMVVWGGASDFGSPSRPTVGGRYDPVADTWAATSTAGVPDGRSGHIAVWTGSLMLVWGGWTGGPPVIGGARYDPVLDAWSPISTTNAPLPAFLHTAVWTGDEMVIWGGFFPQVLGTGARYDPDLNSWRPTSGVNAPSARTRHSAVWTGSRMIVWGGRGDAGTLDVLNDGASYDPVGDAWTAISAVNAPPARDTQQAVWTGDRMVVWGGWNGDEQVATGGQYLPTDNVWAPTSVVGVPDARHLHTAVWTGDFMLVWGGLGRGGILGNGSRYIPALPATDADGDGLAICQWDCDDSNSAVHPGAGEVCNGIDDDCDGTIDGADGDGDGAVDACDCAPSDPGSWAPPDSSVLVFRADHVTLSWSSVGFATTRSVVRGSMSELPVGSGPSETCLVSNFAGPETRDETVPSAGQGFWYLFKGTNACGPGSYGQTSDGTPRLTAACP